MAGSSSSTETPLDGSSFEATLEFTFEPHSGTLVTMIHSGFPSEELREEHTIGVPTPSTASSARSTTLGAARAREEKSMSSSVLYMSMSLDGFIAGPGDDAEHGLGVDGEVLHKWLGEWVDAGPTPSFQPPGESATVHDELMKAGAVVVGRRTFDLAGHWGGDHHGGVPIFVPTRREPPEPASELVRYVTDGVESAMRHAKDAAGEADLMVHGADLAQSLLREGVLDELQIHLVPILLGEGRRLFEHLGAEHTDLELTRVLEAPGVLHLRYRVIR